MLKATKVRIYPTTEQAEFLNAQFGAVRFAYNKALHLKNRAYSRFGISVSPKKDLKPLLSIGKKSRKYHWLGDYDSIALQQSVINLDKAFKNFFNPKIQTRFPKFKSKHDKQSSYHCVGVKVLDDAIKIPKLKSTIKAKIHREIDGKVKSITLSRTPTGKFYASILVDNGAEVPTQMQSINEEQVVGVDMGLSHLLIESNNNKVENPRFLIRAEANLRRKQKSLSRKKKGSKSRSKARLLVAKAHEKTTNARNDFQHKLSKRLVDENQAIVVETLKVKNMLKNRKLSKHIADASWSSLITKLEYKARYAGKHLVKIDQWFPSSKTCSICDAKVATLPLHIREWTCSCGAKLDRDINAAINVKQQGILKLKAEGVSVSANRGFCISLALPQATAYEVGSLA